MSILFVIHKKTRLSGEIEIGESLHHEKQAKSIVKELNKAFGALVYSWIEPVTECINPDCNKPDCKEE